MNKTSSGLPPDAAVSELVDAKIAALADWRGAMLAGLRGLIRAADASVVEEWKWSTPAWASQGRLICTGETYKQVVKLTFARGAALPDPTGLFNSSLDGKVRRAIDFRAGDVVDGPALQQLIRAAVELHNKKQGPARK